MIIDDFYKELLIIYWWSNCWDISIEVSSI